MLDKETEVAIKAVRVASQIARLIQRNETLQIRSKADFSPVTVADYACQAVIGLYLLQEFPDDVVIGEEDIDDLSSDVLLVDSLVEILNSVSGHDLLMKKTKEEWISYICHAGRNSIAFSKNKSLNRFWTVDPIDGTKGFLRGSQYAVCLALIENGKVVLGVLGCPNLDTGGILQYAVLGGGAYEVILDDNQTKDAKPNRIMVSEKKSKTIFFQSFEASHSSQHYADSLLVALGENSSSTEVIKMDSQCKYAALSRGDGHVFLRVVPDPNYREKIWDHASGSLIVSEAGGIVTDIRGKSLDFTTLHYELNNNRGILATCGPPEFHADLLSIISKVDDPIMKFKAKNC